MSMFQGKIVIITGGCSGIGFQICRELLKLNIKNLGILDVNPNEDNLNQLKKEFPNIVFYVKCDVSCKKDVESSILSLKNLFGQIHIFINCAGICNESLIENTINVNLNGVINCSLTALKLMEKNSGGEGGVILTIASLVGLSPCYPIPVYCSTKYGVIGFTRCMSHENIERNTGVKFMAVCPGITETPILTVLDNDYSTHWFIKKAFVEILKGLPVQKPNAVAESVINALTQNKNGSVWVINGGINKEVILNEIGLDYYTEKKGPVRMTKKEVIMIKV